MAIKSVTANLNNQTYSLTKIGDTDTYEANIIAPSLDDEYNLVVTAMDEAGHFTVVDEKDAKFGNLMRILVGKNNADLRETILTNSLGNRMLDMVAPIYDASKIALYLFQCLGITLEKETEFVVNDFISQIYPQTATWGLKYWEEEFGIDTDTSKSIQQRRNYILNKYHKCLPMTPRRLEQIVKSIVGFTCEVTENVAPNTILVVIRGYVRDVEKVRKELATKTPAHLIYLIQMAELVELEATTSFGFAVSEAERYEVEVIQ